MATPSRRSNLMKLYTYRGYEPSSSCYLDGRYVNLVLSEIEEFVQEPIHIRLVYNKHQHLIEEDISSDFIKLRKGMNIIRVVINTTYTAHSALLWLNTETMTAEYTDVKVEGSSRIHSPIPRMLEEYISVFGDFNFRTTEYVVPVTTTPNCEKQGYCNAHVINEVLSWYTGEYIDLDTDLEVLKFVAAIEALYGKYLDDNDKPEIEYFGLGLGLGLLGGIAIGSAISSNRR